MLISLLNKINMTLSMSRADSQIELIRVRNNQVLGIEDD